MSQRQQHRDGASAPAPSQTTTENGSQSLREQQPTRVLRLRGARDPERRTVQWAEDVVDNEGLGRKSSKVCCIYHKPKAVDESSDESSSSSDESSDDCDSRQDADRKGKGKGHGCGGDHDHSHGRSAKSGSGHRKQKRPPSPNAYEKIPKPKPKDQQPSDTKA